MEQRLWILKSKGDKSGFAGNDGYTDQLESSYLYNTNVKNHDKIKTGDYIAIVDKKYILGIATVGDIEVKKDVPQKRYRCPECNTQEHYSRKSVTPKYKCRNKHEFDVPAEEDIVVDEFKATYSSTFIASAPKTSVKLLDSYYINRNFYYSIQQAKVDFIQDIYPGALGLLTQTTVTKTTVTRQSFVKTDVPSYIPSVNDSREYKILKSYIRPKQDKFRNNLIKIYGPNCMLTGCDVLIAVEASHICPYKGEKDNHFENGILLRRDLHSLYDADLIGIDPETLSVSLDPSLINTYLSEYSGRCLNLGCAPIRPSKEALEIRWRAFLESSQTTVTEATALL